MPLRAVEPRRARAGVLLLHGLTGTPIDVAGVAEALTREGYTVRTPLLPGRGTRPEDMDGLSWEDWLAPVLRCYDELAAEHQQVVVGGLSAGATMALDVALRRSPAALLLYAPAVALSNRWAYLAPYVWRVMRRWPCPPSDRVDTTIDSPCYDPMPMRAIAELVIGMRRLRGRVGEIRTPALIAHANADALVPVAHARELARELSGPVTTLFVDGAGHSITIDASRGRVIAGTVAFLRETLAPRALRSA